MDEIVVRISDVVLRVLLRWRIILLCAVICAIGVDAYTYKKDKAEARRVQGLIADYEQKMAAQEEELLNAEAQFQESVIGLEEFEQNLTERQISEVKGVLSMYKKYQQVYSGTLDYINNSIKMQVDPNAVPRILMQYVINTHYSVVYPEITKRDFTADILGSIYNKMMDNQTLDEIASMIGEDFRPSYIRELIGAWTTGSDVYCISVIGRDREECEKIITVLKRELPRVINELKTQYGDFDFDYFNEMYYETFDQDMLNAQQTQADKLKSLRNTTNDLLGSLTEDQKTYFYALLNNDETITLELPVEQDSTVTEELIDPTTLTVPIAKPISPKHLALGAVIGIVIAGLFFLLRILISGKMISDDTIEKSSGIASLGVWNISEEPKGLLSGIDRWLLQTFDRNGRQFSSEESLSMIVAGIRIAAAKNKWKKVYLTGTPSDEESNKALSVMCDRLKGQVEMVSYGKSIIYDPESLEALTNSDAAVVVERTDVSRYNEIKREFALCKQHQIPLMGYVVLK